MHELGAAEWQAHIDNDLEQSKDIAVIKMAMFGDMNKPETLRNALHPTMMRINAFIDVWKWPVKMKSTGSSTVAASRRIFLCPLVMGAGEPIQPVPPPAPIRSPWRISNRWPYTSNWA